MLCVCDLERVPMEIEFASRLSLLPTIIVTQWALTGSGSSACVSDDCGSMRWMIVKFLHERR
jgi:hypothetical protein